jgi:hypothetical protein
MFIMNAFVLRRRIYAGIKNSGKFKEFSDYAVKNFIASAKDASEETKRAVSRFAAENMAIGAEIKKPEHIMTGVVIGVAGTLGVLWGNKLYNDYNKEEIEEIPKEKVDFQPEVLNIIEEEMVVKRVARDDKDALKSIVEEIKENEKVKK